MSEKKELHHLGPIQYFISGGAGGMLTVFIGHPFDTIKVRLQSQATIPQTPKQLESTGKATYNGMLDCVKKTLLQEGILGFYKGMSMPLIAVAPIFATSFLGYKIGKILVHPGQGPFTYWHTFWAGCFSGIFTAAIMTPAERVKCLLQIQASQKSKLYHGPLDCLLKLWKEGGISSIYRGTAATLLRDIPGNGVYFLTYEFLKNYLSDNVQVDLSVGKTLFAGGMTGISFWLVAMPFDVLKTRLQTAPPGTYPNGVRDVLWMLLKHEGPLAFYTGVWPVMWRAFPANAACFVGYEASRSFFEYAMPNTVF